MSTAAGSTGLAAAPQWDDKKFLGLIGDKEVSVLATIKEAAKGDTNNLCVLFRYNNVEDKNIYALRWKLGAILDLGTDELALAKGSCETMFTMEDGDDE